MICRTCDRDEFLVRGWCKHCAPRVHRNRAELIDEYAEAANEFVKQTGMDVLTNWYEFESWWWEKWKRDCQ